MQPVRVLVLAAALSGSGLAQGAEDYPLSLTMDANLTAGPTTVNSVVTIQVERLMSKSGLTRVSNELKFGGYTRFLNALRPLPVVGAVEVNGRKVDLRYANEQRNEAGRRLVLVSDQPLFFLSSDPDKNRTGYQLTIVELNFDAKGSVSGTMAGAARVKPSPDGSVVLDDFSGAPVKLTRRVTKP